MEICKEFYIARGYEPVAVLISHIGWLVDINMVNAEDLVTIIQGLNKADAQAVVDGQPYKQTRELVERGILSLSAYELVKGQVIVRERADIPGASRAPSIVSGLDELEW